MKKKRNSERGNKNSKHKNGNENPRQKKEYDKGKVII